MSKTYQDKGRYEKKERMKKRGRELQEWLASLKVNPEMRKQVLKSGARKRAKLNKVKGNR